VPVVAVAPLTIEEARGLWKPAGPYLDTASYGLPPKPAWEALQAALDEWHGGTTKWERWDKETGRARAAFARLVGVPVERVAVGASVSMLVGLVAAAFQERTRVSAYERDFASLLWPWLARGHDVSLAELERVPHERADVIAVSAVQSSSGALADLDAVAAADAFTVVDGTHAVGWLPLDASRFDAVVCAAYKWLCSPRGTAFLAVSERLLERLSPLWAGWYAAEDPYSQYYGAPLRLAADARRFDNSPAWFSWVGTAPTLELFEEIGVDAIHVHDVALANRFRAGLGLDPGDSAIVSTDVVGVQERFERAGIRAATMAGSVRASFHVYTTEADVDAALDALAG
jgi:selenocysteine lyase/cysteine desulfurase